MPRSKNTIVFDVAMDIRVVAGLVKWAVDNNHLEMIRSKSAIGRSFLTFLSRLLETEEFDTEEALEFLQGMGLYPRSPKQGKYESNLSKEIAAQEKSQLKEKKSGPALTDSRIKDINFINTIIKTVEEQKNETKE